MTDQSFKFPRFFVTAPSPCPYLPGRLERKVFAELKRRDAPEMNEALARIGFRRSQNIVYRPACENCDACVSARVVASEFTPGASQKRLLKRHADLEVAACQPWSTQEQFDLLQDYVSARHPTGGMAMMDAFDFADMVEQTPVDTVVVEYRDPVTKRLVGACLTDKQSDGLSMVYSFYAADLAERPGLGTFIILDHIVRAARAGLPFVYLGYWIDGCDRMTYKTRFKPVELLGVSGWRRAA